MYQLYGQIHDAFGGVNRESDLSQVMKDLIGIQKSVRSKK
jgi:L-ribulokinase